MSFEPREINDPGVSGKLTPVQTEHSGTMYIREGMSVAEAMAYGQAALDAKDARIGTITRQGKRFPTYETNPVIERERIETQTRLRAEVEIALKDGLTADVRPTSERGIPRVEVVKAIRDKYPVQFQLRLLWVRLRDWLLITMEKLNRFLRRV